MGDIGTHAKIAKEVIDLLGNRRPGDNYIYFEIGNWFTDTSQLRDSFAHIGAKIAIWDQGLKAARRDPETPGLARANQWFADYGADVQMDLDEYLDGLMGSPGANAAETTRGGFLAEWMRYLSFVWGWEKFRHMGVPLEEFESLFTVTWTQYFPHEHMDFPPWPYGSVIGERDDSDRNLHQCPALEPQNGGGRKLYKYQELQIEYLACLFTVIDRLWARVPAAADNEAERHRMLVRFGHASHAVEDFFFHSNFVEKAWSTLNRPLPPQSAAPAGSDSDPHEDPNPTREQRIYYRRRRTPIGNGMILDRQNSGEMNQVYTGYFASKDIFHTLMDALDGLEGQGLRARTAAANVPSIPGIIPDPAEAEQFLRGFFYPLRPVDPNLPEDQRTAERKSRNIEQKRRLDTDYYQTEARRLPPPGDLHPKSLDAIDKMCALDRRFWDTYLHIKNGKREGIDYGISGMLGKIIDEASFEENESKKRSQELDRAGIIEDQRTDNGASGEHIGSHTLMAKDSERKHPLRQQTINLAKCAALYIAERMTEDQTARRRPVARSTSEPPGGPDAGAANTLDARNIDWLHLLQHFLSHPAEAEPALEQDPEHNLAWWRVQVDAVDYASTGHQVRFLPSEAIAQQRADREDSLRSELQERYNRVAEDAERAWRSKMRGVNASGGAAVGGLIGAIVGAVAGAIVGAIIGAQMGGVGGAILGGLIGAVGGALIGGLLGAGIGALAGMIFGD